MKLTTTEIVLTILIVVLAINNVQIDKGDTKVSTTLLFLQEHIQRIEAGGEKVVVIFSSGAVYKADGSGQELYFRDKVLLRNLESNLKKRGYTVLSVNTPCLANGRRCLGDFNRLAIGIANLEPEAIIYKGIDSGLGTTSFGNIMKDQNIPIYTVGTQVLLDNELYVGPDNVGLGRVAYEGIKPIISKDQTAIYVETVRLTNGDNLENGFPRINSARQLMTKAGVKNHKTLFTNWDKTQTYSELLKTIREKGSPVDYIIVPSTETAEGAVEAIKTLGHQEETKIIALDFTLKISELLLDGYIYGAVPQNFIKQSEYLSEAIEGKAVGSDKKLFVGEFLTKQKIQNQNIDNLW